MSFFEAGFELEFQIVENEAEFLQEYFSLGALSALGKWKKLAIKTEMDDDTRLIFDLLLSVKGDILRLEKELLKKQNLLYLNSHTQVLSLNFDYLKLSENLLENEKKYYARFDLNEQKIALFFEAKSKNLAKITKIKAEDKSAYDAFVVELQREIIRSKREKDE